MPKQVYDFQEEAEKTEKELGQLEAYEVEKQKTA